MKILALAALLLPRFAMELVGEHDVAGDIGYVDILVAYGVVAVLAAAVLGYTWWRLDADRARRAA